MRRLICLLLRHKPGYLYFEYQRGPIEYSQHPLKRYRGINVWRECLRCGKREDVA